MRSLTFASLFALATALHAADVSSPTAPQPRPRLSPEIIATITGHPVTPAPTVDDTAMSKSPVLREDAAAHAAARARGEIVEMAPYIVNRPKAKAPSEYQMLTPKGRTEAALEKRPGLKFLNPWGLNNGIALAMLEEDRAVERQHEAAELLNLYLIK